MGPMWEDVGNDQIVGKINPEGIKFEVSGLSFTPGLIYPAHTELVRFLDAWPMKKTPVLCSLIIGWLSSVGNSLTWCP